MIPPVPFERIKIDPESILPGDWFLPVDRKGACRHDQIPLALHRGAAGFFFEPGKVSAGDFYGIPRLECRSLRETLYSLASAKRKKCRGRFALITGSNGKTTVKEMLASMVPLYKSPANQNTKLSLSSQLLALPEATPLAVFEAGAAGPGDLSVGTRILQPQVVVLLNVGSAHQGAYEDPGALLEEKLSALDAPTALNLVVPASDPRILSRAREKSAEVRTFGPGGDYSAIEVGDAIEVRGEGMVFRLPNRGLPAYLENAAAAVAAARSLGISREEIVQGLGNFSPPPSRFESRLWRGKEIIDDAFNSSPESLEAGWKMLLSLHGTRRLALIIGSMLELGADSDSFHRAAGTQLKKLSNTVSRPILLLTVGREAHLLGRAAEGERIQWTAAARPADAESILAEHLGRWDVAYLKGSKALGLSRICREPCRHPFP